MKMAADREDSHPVGLFEISRVLEETARLVREHPAAADELALRSDRFSPDAAAARRVRVILALRRLRRQYVGLEASDAAWTLMLELYAAHLEGRRLHQRALAVAARMPETTALQATRRLLRAGIVRGAGDPADKRLLLLSLSDLAARRIRAYLTETEIMAAHAI